MSGEKMSGENGSNGTNGGIPKIQRKDGFNDGAFVEITIRGVVFSNGTDPEKTPDHVWIRATGYGPIQVPKSQARIV